jgi:hypothetical protein
LPSNPFPIVSRTLPGGRRCKAQTATCAHCGLVSEFDVAGGDPNGLSAEAMLIVLRDMGWSDKRAHGLECPACLDRGTKGLMVFAKSYSEPDAVRAMFGEFYGRPLTDEEFAAQIDAMRLETVLCEGFPDTDSLIAAIRDTGFADTVSEIPLRLREEPPMAEPSAKPNALDLRGRDDKRRVNEALTAHYTGEENGYGGDWSDGKIASTLSVPEALVKEIRLQFYGENPGNEATGANERKRMRQVNECRADIHRIEQRLMTEFSKAESELSALKGRLDRLGVPQ